MSELHLLVLKPVSSHDGDPWYNGRGQAAFNMLFWSLMEVKQLVESLKQTILELIITKSIPTL